MAFNYENARGTTHLQNGIAGGAGQDNFTVPQAPWEAFRDTTVCLGCVRLVCVLLTRCLF